MVATINKLTLEEQNLILKECINKNIPLAEKLYGSGLTYDSLRYTDYDDFIFEKDNCQFIDDIAKPKLTIPSVSFFSGGGGLDLGFEYAGFNNLASIEANEIFCNTLRRNNPNKIIIGPPDYSGDISDHESLYETLTGIVGLSHDFDGVFHGGPPCQSFSIAANQRFSKEDANFKRKGFKDPKRGGLLFDYLWFISQFRPKAFLIENVDGIANCDTDGKIHSALNELSAIGYIISQPLVANAAVYGVPQNRMRWLIFGTRSQKTICIPPPNNYVTSCYGVFKRPINNTENHITREHSAESIMRYMQLPYGGRDKLGRVDRLNPYLPSKTVIAGGTKGGGRSHLHPFIPRTISVRECARLQTFPDSYIFTGATARQFTQVGNAVPPLLAYKIALALKAVM
jgi:DNA (cytosine-5)-methyltransferase 1